MKERIGVLFFMENNLGGAATQAVDMVTVARELGHAADIVKCTNRLRALGCANVEGRSRKTPKDSALVVVGRGSGFHVDGIKLNVHPQHIRSACEHLSQYTILVYVGLCPHRTREFSAADFEQYMPIYTDPTGYKIAFFTDPFWQKYYPWAPSVMTHMHFAYAFAEAYYVALLRSGLLSGVSQPSLLRQGSHVAGAPLLRMSRFGSVAAYKARGLHAHAKDPGLLVWPHQWRSWKNPRLFVRLAPLLDRVVDVVAYATGIEHYKMRRDHWEEFAAAVRYDRVLGGDVPVNPAAKIDFLGSLPQEHLMASFQRAGWTIDLTGMSDRTGQPLALFVGNYQCVTIEAMMLGCVVLKYENTISPYSIIPQEAVLSMPLETDPVKLAKYLHGVMVDKLRKQIADAAYTWSVDVFNPYEVFARDFVEPAKAWRKLGQRG